MDEHDPPGGATGPLPPPPPTSPSPAPTAEPSSPFAPPRPAFSLDAAAAPPSMAAADDGASDVVVEPVGAARRSRRGLVLGIVAALVVVAGGVGAFVALRGGGGDTFSLDAAATDAADAQALQFDAVIEVGALGEMNINGVNDIADGLTEMEMTGAGLEGGMRLILDVPGETIYMTGDVFEPLLGDAGWLRVAFDDLEATGLGDVDSLTGSTQNPLDIAPLLAKADQVTESGKETIDGVDTRIYDVTVGWADVVAAAPDVEQQLEDAGIDTPSEVTYRVWVTEESTLRRLSYALGAGDQQIETTFDFLAIDGDVSIEVPAIEDTVDISEVMGG